MPAALHKSGQNSILGKIVPWLPRLPMLLFAAFLAIYFISGGANRVLAWNCGKVLLPELGGLTLVLVCLYALFRRRITRNILITGGICLVSMMAAIPLFIQIPYPASIRTTTPSATVRLPADNPLKVYWGGDNRDVNYVHVFHADQRWAYDFLVPPYSNGSSELSDYGCYGMALVSPANGEIVGIENNQPDMIPGIHSNNMKNPYGNYVSIKMDETGTYLLMAHLKPGSVLVSIGERVVEGQEIAQCGNSGNTSEPHIHLHHQLQNPATTPMTLAEGLPLFFDEQNGDPMPEGGVRIENGQVILIGDTVQHTGGN